MKLSPMTLSLVSLSSKPGLHIVGKVVSMCLRPWYYSFPGVDCKKSLLRDCYYQKRALPCEKTAL